MQGCASTCELHKVGKARSLLVCAVSAGTLSFSQVGHGPASTASNSWLLWELDQDQLLSLWMGCPAPHCWRNIFMASSWSAVSERAEHFLGVRRCCAALSCSLPAVGGQRTPAQLSSRLSSQPEQPELQSAWCQGSGRRLCLHRGTFGAGSALGARGHRAQRGGTAELLPDASSEPAARQKDSLWKMSVQVLPNSLSLVVLGGFLLQGNYCFSKTQWLLMERPLSPVPIGTLCTP